MNPLRVRTLTAGVALASARDLTSVDKAIDFLAAAKRAFEAAGYEVQTTRIATTAFVADLDAGARERALADLLALDRAARQAGVMVSIGPIHRDNRCEDAAARWADELVRTTESISFSVVIASGSQVYDAAARSAAQIMAALARSLPEGMGNFRFAAAANIPAGTPFFPAAWHEGADSFAVGLESAGVVAQACGAAHNAADARQRLKRLLDEALQPVLALGERLAAQAGLTFHGVDASPAPGLDRSIAGAIEALTKAPFGAPGSLEACAAVTAALKSLDAKTCGYSGLMLPVLEDAVLARRAGEGRFGVRELLLYSSVCGTGLDVVPIPGDTSVDALSGLLRDVAALSARLLKPLSARLLIVPGKQAGEIASFSNPWLTDAAAMRIA